MGERNDRLLAFRRIKGSPRSESLRLADVESGRPGGYAVGVRVLTLNLWARSGPYPEREPLLRRQLATIGADLIAFQEVDAGPGDDNQARELLDGLGYEVAYQRRERNGDPGIAIASRHPIEQSQSTDLGHGGPALAARIRMGEHRLWFCSTVPMSWKPGFESEREDECVALDAWLTELAASETAPPILAGDFDATPDAASIRFLTGLQSLHGRSTYWLDAFAVAGDGSAGYTWSSDNPYVAPFTTAVFAQPQHRRRIDYIFVGSPFTWQPRILIRSAAVVMQGDVRAAPSDHFAVMADLQLDAVSLGAGQGMQTWSGAKEWLWRG